MQGQQVRLVAAATCLWMALVAAPALATAQVPAPIPGDTVPAAPADTTIPVQALDPDTLPVPSDVLPADVPPPLSASADSVLQALRSLPGYIVTEYQGRSAVYRTDTGTLRLEGDARVNRSGDQLTADTIEFRQAQDLVRALGGARVVSSTQELESEVLYYDVVRRRATALGARTEIVQDATWYVTGDVTIEEPTSTLFGSHAHFTSCDLTIPHYHFEADKVMVIRDQILVARPARLYFGNVPVMVLPFVVQSLEQGRRSGLLTPKFGINDIVRNSSNYTRQISDVGFYWAINDYMGATISTTWRSGAYTSLFGDLQYNWRKQFLNGNFGYDRIWEESGKQAYSVNTQTSWQPDERTNLSMSGRYASSTRFVRDATFDPLEQTQDLMSSLSLNRRFDWSRISLGGNMRQSIATGDQLRTFPQFSITPNAVTFFRAQPGSERWYSNASFTPGVISGSRTQTLYDNEFARTVRQDQDQTTVRLGPSFSVGRFTLGANGDLNSRQLYDAVGLNADGDTVTLAGYERDEVNWSTSASYRQPLIGTSNLSPNIALEQRLVRDTLTTGEYLAAPMRLRFGVGLNADLYGFFPGVGPYSSIRHRISPQIAYSYAPEVVQSALQESVFGVAGGRAQNRITLSINQTFEAKLTNPVVRDPIEAEFDSLAVEADSLGAPRPEPIPSDPEKVTILSLTTSPFEYDFIKAEREGNGFVTERVSNTITSDYLRGLSIQMQHELFDKRNLDPRLPENVGELGEFSPRLSSLSTSFQLGPQSLLFRWLSQLAFGADEEADPRQGGIVPGPLEEPPADPASDGGSFTGNPQGTGGGPWRAAVSYEYSRPPRNFTSGVAFPDNPVQTLNGTIDFQLTPNWTVNWGTSYSITDRDFGAHRLNFRRDLHEWQANFSFFQAPNGNTAFQFYVELTHNQDLRLDYGEQNLGIDRRR